LEGDYSDPGCEVLTSSEMSSMHKARQVKVRMKKHHFEKGISHPTALELSDGLHSYLEKIVTFQEIGVSTNLKQCVGIIVRLSMPVLPSITITEDKKSTALNILY
jgi:hypothetical protein